MTHTKKYIYITWYNHKQTIKLIMITYSLIIKIIVFTFKIRVKGLINLSRGNIK